MESATEQRGTITMYYLLYYIIIILYRVGCVVKAICRIKNSKVITYARAREKKKDICKCFLTGKVYNWKIYINCAFPTVVLVLSFVLGRLCRRRGWTKLCLGAQKACVSFYARIVRELFIVF